MQDSHFQLSFISRECHWNPILHIIYSRRRLLIKWIFRLCQFVTSILLFRWTFSWKRRHKGVFGLYKRLFVRIDVVGQHDMNPISYQSWAFLRRGIFIGKYLDKSSQRLWKSGTIIISKNFWQTYAEYFLLRSRLQHRKICCFHRRSRKCFCVCTQLKFCPLHTYLSGSWVRFPRLYSVSVQ